MKPIHWKNSRLSFLKSLSTFFVFVKKTENLYKFSVDSEGEPSTFSLYPFLSNISLNRQEEEYSCGNHQQADGGIEQACTRSSRIGHDELRVAGGKEPVPVKQGGQHSQ